MISRAIRRTMEANHGVAEIDVGRHSCMCTASRDKKNGSPAARRLHQVHQRPIVWCHTVAAAVADGKMSCIFSSVIATPSAIRNRPSRFDGWENCPLRKTARSGRELIPLHTGATMLLNDTLKIYVLAHPLPRRTPNSRPDRIAS